MCTTHQSFSTAMPGSPIWRPVSLYIFSRVASGSCNHTFKLVKSIMRVCIFQWPHKLPDPFRSYLYIMLQVVRLFIFQPFPDYTHLFVGYLAFANGTQRLNDQLTNFANGRNVAGACLFKGNNLLAYFHLALRGICVINDIHWHLGSQTQFVKSIATRWNSTCFVPLGYGFGNFFNARRYRARISSSMGRTYMPMAARCNLPDCTNRSNAFATVFAFEISKKLSVKNIVPLGERCIFSIIWQSALSIYFVLYFLSQI